MRRLLLLLSVLAPLVSQGRHRIVSPQVKTLQVVVGDDWLSMPVMRLGSDDLLNVAFDELSHNYHRFVAHLEHCEPDWTPTDGLFESDWLEGFNDFPVEDYENSINTTVLYTHYQLQIPNDQCRLRMSGNYRLHILDEDDGMSEVLVAEFRVVEPLMNLGMKVTTNTDIDHNQRHQQVDMTLSYNGLRVINVDEEIQTFVMQNGREDNMKANASPTYTMPTGLQWQHNRQLIFEGGNEYHKFEMLDPSHISMGLAGMSWDEDTRSYHAVPFVCEPQRSYIYDEDADGAFTVRNSDNYENHRTSDYIYVHYKLKALREYELTRVIVDGQWATESPSAYVTTYDPEDGSYNAVILQKQGYYNYQFLMRDLDGITHRMPEEGSFYQTENRYQAFAYYKPAGERTWRLVGYQQIVFKGL